jgi:hypothetical protein
LSLLFSPAAGKIQKQREKRMEEEIMNVFNNTEGIMPPPYKRLTWEAKIAALSLRPDQVYEWVYRSLLETDDFKYIRGKTPGTFEMAVCAEVPLKPWEMDLVREPKELFLYLTKRFSDCPVGKTYPKVTPDDMSKFCVENKLVVTVFFKITGPPPPDMGRLMGSNVWEKF